MIGVSISVNATTPCPRRLQSDTKNKKTIVHVPFLTINSEALMPRVRLEAGIT